MTPSKPKRRFICTRRQVLAMSGACAGGLAIRSPVQTLISGLVEGVISKASLAAGTALPKNYVYVYVKGGICRWYWDLPLVPYGDFSSLVGNPYITTRFSETATANAGAPEYATIPISTAEGILNMPWLWACNLPTADGGTAPMSELIQNMIMIRGIRLPGDGHVSGSTIQTYPNPSKPSLLGSVADGSAQAVPVPSVSLPEAPPYKSEKVGTVPVPDYQDPLGAILLPFDNRSDNTQGFLSRRDAIDAAYRQALRKLGEFARSGHPEAEGMETMRSNAEALLRKGIGDFGNEYGVLLKKYQGLLARSFSTPIPGITDKVIKNGDPALMGAQGTLPTANHGSTVTNADLRTMIQPTTTLFELAEGFAVAEFLLTHRLSSSIALGFEGVRNLNLELHDPVSGADSVNNAVTFTIDEHQTGLLLSLPITSHCWMAIASCLYEFIRFLKGEKIFEETVVQVGSEFSRAPRTDLGGSDHGWMASGTSLFCGAIKAPAVVGNIARDFRVKTSYGTWGATGLTSVDGQETNLDIGHMTSTIATLLNISPPIANRPPLTTAIGKPIVETGRIVDV